MRLNPIGAVADSVINGLDKLFTSDEEREVAKLKMMSELNKPHIIQALTNLEEAKHPSIFVSGWRPALGWLCVVLLAYAWMGRDILTLTLPFVMEDVPTLPASESGELLTLVLALLGLGATRTYEKMKGVARSSWEVKK